ncbi:hypothetical protein Y032_0337g2916 [Ancylostoma ceylanicum]|uniref:Uncharacterized protein n=1 Tax=Ancylostoma ceylanicum TaxID=53326 RepID=A0A016RZF7_9BILA|nr:hypothetical protein Y032_0337g2916 [Ancylostoma ceylanicum]
MAITSTCDHSGRQNSVKYPRIKYASSPRCIQSTKSLLAGWRLKDYIPCEIEVQDDDLVRFCLTLAVLNICQQCAQPANTR